MSARLFAGYERGAVELARALLGAVLVRQIDGERMSGRIVEVEAYPGGEDRASHSHRGRRTERNESMYLAGGACYVYFIYGMHHCLNVVSGARDSGEAVLVRAIEPLEGLASMARRRAMLARRKGAPRARSPRVLDARDLTSGDLARRGRSSRDPAARDPAARDPAARDPAARDLARGPGRLTAALGIDRSLDGVRLSRSSGIWIEEGEAPRRILALPRIGLGEVGAWARKPWRFLDADSPFISAAVPRRS